MRTETPPFFILTGPPGSGKTTLLKALATDLATVPEAARRVLAEERRTGGTATGEQDAAAFVTRMLETMMTDYDAAHGLTLFDRGLPDLLAFCTHYALPDSIVKQAVRAKPYQVPVFFLPAWSAIYENDDERRLEFQGAVDFGTRIRKAYAQSGYALMDVPKQSVKDRKAFVLHYIKAQQRMT